MPLSTAPVLVVGVTSFVGTQVALTLAKAGYKIRGTARTQKKFNDWANHLPRLHGKVEFAEVGDVATPGAFDNPALWADGVEFVVHLASPYTYKFDDNEKDMLRPAIHGTVNLLRAAHAQKSVKRVVITSSFAAINDIPKGARPGYTYTEADWNPVTYDEAKASKLPGFVYAASKKLAEAAAWDFVKSESPAFALSTINMPMVFGPPAQPVLSLPDGLNESSTRVWSLIKGESPPQAAFSCVDVRDVALAHVRALERDDAKGQRYLVSAGKYLNEDVKRIAVDNFPELQGKLEVPQDYEKKESATLDSSKAIKELGLEYISVEQLFIDTIAKLLELEKQLGSR